MMNKGKAAHILDDKLKEAMAAATAVAPGFSQEGIHAFRVAVKKLRAYLRLLNTDEGQPRLKLTKKFHHLYDIAGEIRDAQLKLEQVKKYRAALPSYIKELSASIASGKSNWNEHYDEAILKKLQKKLTAKQLHKLSSATLATFCKQHIKILEEAADAIPGDEMIHECRKSVKDMLYNTKLAEKHWTKAYGKVAHLPLATLDSLSDLLGDYNDERQLLDSQLAYLPRLCNSAEQTKLEKLSTREKKIKEEQKQLLLKELKRFVTAVAI